MGYIRDKMRAYSRASALATVAARELQRVNALHPELAQKRSFEEPLIDFIPRVSPRIEAPRHLAPYVELLERAAREPIRAVVAAPPRHGKTETAVHALSWWLKKYPSGGFAYITYAQALSDSIAFRAKIVAERAGIKIDGQQREWRTPDGGCVIWTSIGGSFTGKGADRVIVVDDPVKDRADAESSIKRQRAWEWFTDVAQSRVEPTTSIIVMATRWHADDLSGRLIAQGWPYLNLQAIADGDLDDDGYVIGDPMHRQLGEALWPSRRPAEFLSQHMRNAYTWASLYQGAPRPRSGTVFREPTYYDELPREYRAGYGVDLAYTAKSSADYSVCIGGRMTSTKMPPDAEHEKPWIKRRLYITSVDRAQVDAPAFTLTMRSRWSAARGPMRWYCASSEKGAAQFVKQKIPTFEIKLATADKFVRSQAVAAAWNDGDVLLPSEHAPGGDAFVGELLEEVLAFTGVKDAVDDQVDALAALWDTLATPEWNTNTIRVPGL